MSTLHDLIDANSKEVLPLADGEMIDYVNVPLAVVRFLRSQPMKPGKGQTKPWLKHVFRAPDGSTFAIGGCMDLDSKLRSIKANDMIALGYEGKKALDDVREQHVWLVRVMAVSGPKLVELARQFEAVYQAIREAVEQKRTERRAGRATEEEVPSEYNDSDMPQW